MKKTAKVIFFFFFYLLNFTWGILQNIIGFIFMLSQPKDCKRINFFGSVCTLHHGDWGGISLGIFICVNGNRDEKWTNETLVHEFGHCVQSMLLGPLYIFLIGIPSFIWCNSKKYITLRKEKAVSYFDFYPEKWANRLGERITGLKAPDRFPPENTDAPKQAENTTEN